MAGPNETPRSAQRKPFQITDINGAGPNLWSFNFLSDTPGTESILSGVFVDGRGEWHKFTTLTIDDTAKSVRAMCAASGVDWQDDYLGMIMTYALDAGFFYCIGSPYDYSETTPSSQLADDRSCPNIVAGDYRTAPLVFGRVFRS